MLHMCVSIVLSALFLWHAQESARILLSSSHLHGHIIWFDTLPSFLPSLLLTLDIIWYFVQCCTVFRPHKLIYCPMEFVKRIQSTVDFDIILIPHPQPHLPVIDTLVSRIYKSRAGQKCLNMMSDRFPAKQTILQSHSEGFMTLAAQQSWW